MYLFAVDECLILMKRCENNCNYDLSKEWGAAAALKLISTPNVDNKYVTDVVKASFTANLITGS